MIIIPDGLFVQWNVISAKESIKSDIISIVYHIKYKLNWRRAWRIFTYLEFHIFSAFFMGKIAYVIAMSVCL